MAGESPSPYMRAPASVSQKAVVIYYDSVSQERGGRCTQNLQAVAGSMKACEETSQKSIVAGRLYREQRHLAGTAPMFLQAVPGSSIESMRVFVLKSGISV